MELALYCPGWGYYEAEADKIGRRGDYYTSVSVGSLFGELLGAQIANWLESMSAGGGKVTVVEAGADRGQLAGDILRWMRAYRQGLYERLEYYVLEPSSRRRQWQEERLGKFEGRVRWASDWLGLVGGKESRGPAEDSGGVRGVIFANELLDSMPVHRLAWDAQQGRWVEWGVSLRNGRFRWAKMGEGAGLGWDEPMGLEGSGRWLELGEGLPDGFVTEWCPAAWEWWRGAARVLTSGWLMSLDYGSTAEELVLMGRGEGTLRAYLRHRLSGDILACPGEQDITAHVNFSAIRAAGESEGLRTAGFVRQDEFLTSILERLRDEVGVMDQWTPAKRRQFQTLTHPEFLGRRFRVLTQARGV